jgi:cold shock CspA family protein
MSCENRKHGNVKKYFSVGYGFLFCEDVPVDIFFHLNNWRSAGEPVVGQKVTFELGPAKKEGQPMQAVLIHPVVSAGLEALARGLSDPINGEVSPEIGASSQGGVYCQ